MQDSLLAMSIVWGPRRLLLYNDAYIPFLADKHPWALGKPLEQVWPEIWDVIGPLVDRARAGESFQQRDMPLTLLRNGRRDRAWFTFYYSPVRDEGGQIQGMCSSVVETTERVLAEKRQAALLALSDGLAATRDTDDLIRLAAEACRAYLEPGTEAVLARIPSEILPAQQERLAAGEVVGTTRAAPVGRGRLLVPLVHDSRLAAVLDLTHAEEPAWTAVDEAFAQEVSARATAWLEKMATAASLIEVTESERRMRALADALPQIIWITDRDGQTEYFNREWSRYTGHPNEGLHADQIAASLLHPDDSELTRQRFEEARRTEGVFAMEHRIRRADGEYRWFLVRGEPQRDAVTGEITRWIGSSVDIHDRKVAEDRLRLEDRRKDEFLATLAHELRNPLAPIRTGLQIVRLTEPGAPPAEKALSVMDRQLTHMVRLIDDLLDVSRIRSGKIELKKETVDLRSVIDMAVEASRPLVDAGHHSLVLHVSALPLRVHADPARLTQVVSNLLNNAAKYTPDGGSIDLTLEPRNGQAMVVVTDNGVGIAGEMLPRVFDMFTQVGKTTGRAEGGLGIGLSICRSLIEMHGGTISAESRGPGLGSTFKVTLPLIQAADTPQAPAATTAPAVAARVLVVDDNVDAAESLAALLHIMGHDARVATSGPQALEIGEAFAPQVVICDIGMPGMNGHEVARRFRADHRMKDTLLVALTGWGAAEDKREAIDAGFSMHLTKPVDAAHLQKVIAQVS